MYGASVKSHAVYVCVRGGHFAKAHGFKWHVAFAMLDEEPSLVHAAPGVGRHRRWSVIHQAAEVRCIASPVLCLCTYVFVGAVTSGVSLGW